MKSATVFLAPLVALLLLLPAPASAAPLTTLQQSGQVDILPTPTPGTTPEPTRQPTVEPTAEPTAEPTIEPTAAPTEPAAEEPTAEPTPESEASNPISDLHATAGRLRGRVDIGWGVTDSADQTGGSVFVVERSTNGSSWRPVKACYVPYDGETQDYGCTDSRLSSGATYAYRVCLTGKATSCSNALTTDPVSVKAP